LFYTARHNAARHEKIDLHPSTADETGQSNMSKIFDFVKPGVITGDDVQKVFAVAKENNFALPAVNCVGTDSINAVLEQQRRCVLRLSYSSLTAVPRSSPVKA
jgi:hypothetical protein